MQVVRLSAEDAQVLAARFAEHGNSHRRMAGAFRDAGAGEAAERLCALRRLECRFQVDLGSLCHRFRRRDQAATHPIERMVLDYVAEDRERPDGGREVWVHIDRVRQVRAWVEQGQPVREPE